MSKIIRIEGKCNPLCYRYKRRCIRDITTCNLLRSLESYTQEKYKHTIVYNYDNTNIRISAHLNSAHHLYWA
jgi:hypothetical protein